MKRRHVFPKCRLLPLESDGWAFPGGTVGWACPRSQQPVLAVKCASFNEKCRAWVHLEHLSIASAGSSVDVVGGESNRDVLLFVVRILISWPLSDCELHTDTHLFVEGWRWVLPRCKQEAAALIPNELHGQVTDSALHRGTARSKSQQTSFRLNSATARGFLYPASEGISLVSLGT